MYSYKLKKTRDTDFFSAPHYDAISTALLKDEDVVCVCNDCGELYLQSSWEANDGKCYKCGCSSRKNLNEQYFHRYKINTQRVEKTRNRSSATTRRRNMVPVGTVSNPVQTVTPVVTRRPVGGNSSRNNNAGNVSSLHRTIVPQPYPRSKRKRKKTGRILLGLVLTLIIIALIIGTVLVLENNGMLALNVAMPSFLYAGGVSEPLSVNLLNNSPNSFVCVT